MYSSGNLRSISYTSDYFSGTVGSDYIATFTALKACNIICIGTYGIGGGSGGKRIFYKNGIEVQSFYHSTFEEHPKLNIISVKEGDIITVNINPGSSYSTSVVQLYKI